MLSDLAFFVQGFVERVVSGLMIIGLLTLSLTALYFTIQWSPFFGWLTVALLIISGLVEGYHKLLLRRLRH